jgi:hypothetical protein
VKLTGSHREIQPPSTTTSHCALAPNSMFPHELMTSALAVLAKPRVVTAAIAAAKIGAKCRM